MLSRLTYYLKSFPVLITGIVNWPVLAQLVMWKKPVRIHLKSGLIFWVRTPMDVWVIKETCLDECYGRVSTHIQDGWTVIDVGAGLGDFSIHTAKRYPSCRVLAFEPFPSSFDLLKKNLQENKTGNLQAYDLAVSAWDGVLTLVAGSEETQSRTFTAADNQGEAILVHGISLTSLLAKEGLSHCDYLKMDCEGAEFDILLNADADTLSLVDHICLEFHDGFTEYSHVDLVTHLEKFGFQIRLTPNPVHDHLGFLYAYRADRSEANA